MSDLHGDMADKMHVDPDAPAEARRKAKALERLQMDINWRLTVEANDADNLIYAQNNVVNASATITLPKSS